MSAPSRDQRPQFGWNRVTLMQDETLGEPGGVLPSTSATVTRPNGVTVVTISGRVDGGDTTGAPTDRFGYVVEGSNTGGSGSTEWIIVGETNLGENFAGASAGTRAAVLGLSNGSSLVPGTGFIGEAQLPVDRWKYLRVRTIVESGTPVFEMHIRMVGIGADGQTTLTASSLVRVSGASTEPSSTPVKRPEGVRFMSAQIDMSAMILIGGGSFSILLQVALNGNAVDNDQWVTLDVLSFAATGYGFFTNGQSRVIDLAGFQFYRFTVERVAPAATTSSFTASCISTFDDSDWITGEAGVAQLDSYVRNTFVMVVFDPVSGVAPNLVTRVQICDMNQIPIRAVRFVALILTDSPQGFSNDLNAAASFASVTGPAAIAYGTGTNTAVIQTDSAGTATIQISTGAASPLYICAWNEWIPAMPSTGFFGPGQIVIATQKLALVP